MPLDLSSRKLSSLCELEMQFINFGEDADKLRGCIALYTDSDGRLEQVLKLMLRTLDKLRGYVAVSHYDSAHKILENRISCFLPWGTERTSRAAFKALCWSNKTSLEVPSVFTTAVANGANLDKVVKTVYTMALTRLATLAKAGYQAYKIMRAPNPGLAVMQVMANAQRMRRR